MDYTIYISTIFPSIFNLNFYFGRKLCRKREKKKLLPPKMSMNLYGNSASQVLALCMDGWMNGYVYYIYLVRREIYIYIYEQLCFGLKWGFHTQRDESFY